MSMPARKRRESANERDRAGSDWPPERLSAARRRVSSAQATEPDSRMLLSKIWTMSRYRFSSPRWSLAASSSNCFAFRISTSSSCVAGAVGDPLWTLVKSTWHSW